MFQYSVILGNVGQCSDRYMTCGYGRPFEIPELFERVASIPGVTGIEYIGNWLSGRCNYPGSFRLSHMGERRIYVSGSKSAKSSNQRNSQNGRTCRRNRLPDDQYLERTGWI